MGANAQTSVPTFTAGDVLTAANMNISARTGVPVFASTVTRDAAFGGTGEKTLAEGQMCYIEGTGFQTYNGTSWVTWGTAPSSGALTYLTGATFTAQTTVAFANDVFTSTYANYLVLFESTGDSAQRTVSLQVRDNAGTKTAANYFGGSYGVNQAGTGTAANSNGATSFGLAANANNDPGSATIAITVCNPQSSTKKTTFFGSGNVVTAANVGSFNFGGQYNIAETHTGLTFTFSAASTGLYRVYGYANS